MRPLLQHAGRTQRARGGVQAGEGNHGVRTPRAERGRPETTSKERPRFDRTPVPARNESTSWLGSPQAATVHSGAELPATVPGSTTAAQSRTLRMSSSNDLPG